MNILKPELVWIGDRCYRKLPIKDQQKQDTKEVIRTSRYDEMEEDQVDDLDLQIKHQGSRFFLTYPIPHEFIGFLKGRSSATQKAIQDSTSTELVFPVREVNRRDTKFDDGYADNARKEEFDLGIIGAEKSQVIKAYRRVQHIVNEARFRITDYTHFISIPMNAPSIQEGFRSFKKNVLLNCKASGINEDLFEKAPKLHLTIAMLTLLTKRERELATGLFLQHKPEILELLGEKQFRIEVKGIEIMNDDLEEVDVLYGKVRETDDDNCLQLISNKLAKAFAAVNLSRGSQNPDVKLHVTLMKSRQSDGGQRSTFDVSQIMEKYAEFTFGQATISEIHISVRFTEAKNQYYLPLHIMQLNS